RGGRRVSGDGHRDAGDLDDSAAELLAAGLGVRDRAARADWRDRRAAHLQSAVRLRRPARANCARRHDHAQHRDPGRSARPRYRGSPRPPSRDHRRDRPAAASGHARRRVISAATVVRARPVILTALAAIQGMIALAGSIFWGPMAISIMGGLLVATALTLLVVPALYALWFRVRSDETIDA